jgi:hypothetical protein
MKRAAVGLVALALVGTALFSGLTACSYAPGGMGYSNGPETYVSDPYSPKTITIKDTRNGQVVWTYEVPVGRQLVMQFFPGEDQTKNFPDLLRWQEMPAGMGSGELSNSMPVPPQAMCFIDVSLRSTPEYHKNGAGAGKK